MPEINTMTEINAMTVEELRILVVKQNEKIIQLEREIEALKASLKKNSKNSSKPPSTDGFRRPANLREKTGNKPGGVEGHEGHCLQMPDGYQELIDKGLAAYELIDHTDGREDYVSKWVIDIRVTPVFIEHRFMRGEVPAQYNNDVIYGEEVKALSVHLTDDGMVSAERLADFFSSVTDGVVHPTKAALLGFENELAEALAPEIVSIKEDIICSPVIHTDDSPMKCTQTIIREDGKEDVYINAQGKTFNVNTRTYATERSILYTVNPKKDLAGVYHDDILNNCDDKIIVHDHDKKFYHFGRDHGECNVHPCRDLKGLNELGIAWAGEMRDFLLYMNDYKNEDMAKGSTACAWPVIEDFSERYSELLKAGRLACDALDVKSYGYKKLNALVERFYEYSHEHLLFIYDYAVPFSNNLAERSLRAEKTKEKVSGCFRSWRGIEGFIKIRSFIATVRIRGLNVLDSLRSVFKGERVLVSYCE